MSPDFATCSLALHKHVVSDVINKLSCFTILALGALEPMFCFFYWCTCFNWIWAYHRIYSSIKFRSWWASWWIQQDNKANNFQKELCVGNYTFYFSCKSVWINFFRNLGKNCATNKIREIRGRSLETLANIGSAVWSRNLNAVSAPFPIIIGLEKMIKV